MISLSQHCLPKDPEKINQCFAVFTDLDQSDVHNKDLYIACQVIRVGNDLEGKKTASPIRKAHGAAVYPIYETLRLKGDLEEKDVQMEVFTYVCLFACASVCVSVRTYIHIYIHACLCVCVCVHMCGYACMHSCVHECILECQCTFR